MQPASWKPAAGLALRIQLPPDEPNWSLPSTERSATPMSTTSDNPWVHGGRKRPLPHERALPRLSPRRAGGNRTTAFPTEPHRRAAGESSGTWAAAPPPGTAAGLVLEGQRIALAPASGDATPLAESGGGHTRYDLLRSRPSRIPRASSAPVDPPVGARPMRLKPLDPTFAATAPAATQAMRAAASGARPSRLPGPAGYRASSAPAPLGRRPPRATVRPPLPPLPVGAPPMPPVAAPTSPVPARRVGAASPPIDPMAWSPPVQRPPAGANSPPVQFAQTAPARSGEGGRVRLCFDAVLGCYFDPVSGRYYQLR